MIEGGCLCGKIRYAVNGEITDVSHCHCSMCRKMHGAAFATNGVVQQADFQWSSGQDMVKTYRSSPDMERTFCGHCGSTLQCLYDPEPEVIYLALGTVDGDPGCRPSYHIWVGSKAPWYEIADDLPKFETWEDA